MSTFVQYDGTGETWLFQVPFPYVARAHVKVYLNGFPQVEGVHFQWDNDSTIHFMPWAVPAAGTLIEIRRETPTTALVTFQNGSALVAGDLNTATVQSLFGIEEVIDKYEARFNNAGLRLSNGQYTDAENLINAAVADVLNSTLLADLQARISDINTNAESILEQTLRLDGVDARMVNIETMATDGYNAMFQALSLMGAQSDDNTSFILNTATVKVNPTESIGTVLEQLQVADGENTAAIQSLQNVVAGPNGLSAQWMVKTDVNGHVAGIGLYNDGASSQFIVNAGTFAVSNGTDVKIPFVITNGVCYMQNVVVSSAIIENLTVGKLTSGTLTATITQNADINVGTGRIIWSNGAYMKVAGVGFGTLGQFIEWFGPVMSVGSCSEANAIYYLKTNGSAYFGGSLSAGTLKTSGQTSDINATATVTIGPFGTNGNPINVVLSYNMSKYGSESGTGNQDQSFPIHCYLNLYRSIGGGGEALVAQLNLSGACVHGSNVPGEGHSYGQTLNGSTTYTDTAGGTGLRTYRAVIASRSLHHIPGGQTISIVATEQ